MFLHKYLKSYHISYFFYLILATSPYCLPYFSYEEFKSAFQRDPVTLQQWYSYKVVQLRFEPRQTDSKVLALRTLNTTNFTRYLNPNIQSHILANTWKWYLVDKSYGDRGFLSDIFWKGRHFKTPLNQLGFPNIDPYCQYLLQLTLQLW